MNLEEKVEIYDTQALSIANANSGSARFIIVAESVSAHCCFEYSVIDTKEGSYTFGDYWKKIMCETFDKDEAVMICYALKRAIAANGQVFKAFGGLWKADLSTKD